jgi:tRNA dimethylallyltransferase
LKSKKTNKLIVIIGPTAIGKTSLSIEIAKYFGSEILSCDSRQFYKETTIGTAVPTKEELNTVNHHFIQNKSIKEEYNVGDFEKESLKKLNDLFLKNSIQVMVGGSGLYVNAVLKGLDNFPNIEPNVRDTINKEYDEKGLRYLQETLKIHDPFFYAKITSENPQTLQNPQRMKRFVEVCLGTGKPYSSFLGNTTNERNFDPIIIGLEADREVMYQRINKRVDIMIQEGLVEEAQNVHQHRHLNALQTVGYKELFDYFEGKSTLQDAIELIKQNTRRFAKRQLTWFKRTENVMWYDYNTDSKEIIKYIERQL